MAHDVGYVSTAQAAQMLGVHENTVRARIERGEIPAENVGQGRVVYRIPLSWLTMASPSTSVPHNVVAFWRAQWDASLKKFSEEFSKEMDLARKLGAAEARIAQLEAENEFLKLEQMPRALANDEFVPSQLRQVP